MEKTNNVKKYQKVIDFANIFKAFIGTNYLSLSYGFSQAGLGFALIMLIIVAGLTNHCCKLLVKCKHLLVEDVCSKYKSLDENMSAETEVAHLRKRLEKNLDYADIGKLSVGRWGSVLVNVFLVLTQIGFCVGYMVFVGNMLLNFLPQNQVNGTAGNSTKTEWSDLNVDVFLDHRISKRLVITNQSFHEVLSNFSDASADHFAEEFIRNRTETPSLVDTDDSLPLKHPWKMFDAAEEEDSEKQDSGFSLLVLVVIPLPLFVIFTMFRNVRQLGIVSVLANTSIIIGFACVLVYIIVDFKVSEGYSWFVWTTLPVYIAQVIGAYEAIGTIIPIEASMENNKHKFNRTINIVVVGFTLLIGVLSTLGYLHYGHETKQIIAQNLPPESPVVILINVTLTFGVLCTYPLQIYPVVEILENMIFAEGKCCGPPVKTLVDAVEDKPLLEDEETVSDMPTLSLHVASYVPDSVPAWKRNLLRLGVAVSVSGLAILMRNVFAYIGAIVGAIGSCPLAFILPCLFHIKINRSRMSSLELLKDIVIIVFGAVCGAIGFIVTVIEIIKQL